MSIRRYKKTVDDLKESLNRVKHQRNRTIKPIKELIKENENYFNNLSNKPLDRLDKDDEYFLNLNLQIMGDFTEEDLKEFDMEEKQIINSRF